MAESPETRMSNLESEQERYSRALAFQAQNLVLLSQSLNQARRVLHLDPFTFVSLEKVESPATENTSTAVPPDAHPMPPMTPPTSPSLQSPGPINMQKSPVEQESSCVHQRIMVEGSNNLRLRGSVLSYEGSWARCPACGASLQLVWTPAPGADMDTSTSAKPESPSSVSDGSVYNLAMEKEIQEMKHRVQDLRVRISEVEGLQRAIMMKLGERAIRAESPTESFSMEENDRGAYASQARDFRPPEFHVEGTYEHA